MTAPELIEKTEIVVQGFLALLGKRISRTQIVKLVYLADNLFYEATGKTITGTQYMWDHYGPNSVDDVIANATDQLVIEGEVRRAVGSYKGSHTFNYWVDDPDVTWKNTASALSDGECQIIFNIVRKYGRYNASDLARLSKRTKPFEDARQYEKLRFKRNERAKEMQEMLDASEGFLEEVRLGFEDLDAGRLVWAHELEERAS